MKFFESAKQMEEQTKNYYLDLADKCAANEGLKNILNMLAKDHIQHLAKFQQMQDDECVELEMSDSFKKTIEYFRSLQKKEETFSCDIKQVNMYKQAKELLEKKLDFYLQGKENMACRKNMSVLDDIIAEENRHKLVLENIIELISRPEYWIENAEFYHFENY